MAARIDREREGAFLEYVGDLVEEDLIWSPTTAVEVEGLCKSLEPGKWMGCDGISPRLIRWVAQEITVK